MSSGYIQRVVDHELDELLPQLPAIALEGAKGVGKTETDRRPSVHTAVAGFAFDPRRHGGVIV